MRKLIFIFIMVTLIGFPKQLPSIAAVKGGISCKVQGQIKFSQGKKYTCIKKGKKFQWNNGVTIPKSVEAPSPAVAPSPEATPSSTESSVPTTSTTKTNFLFNDNCELDPEIPDQWRDVQNWSKTYVNCARPLRYLPGQASTQTVKSQLIIGASLPISQCKLDDQISRPWAWQRFGNPFNLYRPTISAVTQVIPVQFVDLKTDAKPEADYGRYIQFYKDFLVNSSDVPINPEFRLPSKYFQLGFSFHKYRLNDGHAPDEQFIRDVESAIRGELDLNRVDQVLFLLPPDAKYKDFDAKIPFGDVSGTVFAGKSLYLQGPIDSGSREGGKWSIDPWITVHELFGHLMGLDDHFGSENRDPGIPKDWRDLGTGNWGNMSGVNGDFLIWDKWNVGWVSDNQIKCLAASSESTVLVSPNTTKSNFTKAVVVPLTQSRGIVIESQRSTGYNFKYPLKSNGALVYVVEMKEIAHGGGMPWGYGMYVQRPSNRSQNFYQNGFLLGDAALKFEESIVVEGVKISVIEAGDFGDVIKIGKG